VLGKGTVLSLDLNTDGESLMRTACGSEFQTDDAENRKARLEKSVLINGWSSSGNYGPGNHASQSDFFPVA